MDATKLARMANQIALNFEQGLQEEQVIAAVESHLRRSWNSRMLVQLAEAQRQGTVELSELAAQGLAAATRPLSTA